MVEVSPAASELLDRSSQWTSRGEKVPSGFSAVGGQTQSAYVQGGLLEDDLPVGHSVSPLLPTLLNSAV